VKRKEVIRVFEIETWPVELEKATVDEAIEMFVQKRDELNDVRKQFQAIEDQIKNELELISMWLLKKSDELGVESFRTKHGTAFKSLVETYRVGDWATLIEYIKETDNYQLLEKRVAKNAAREIHAAEGAIPPGIDYFAEFEFKVRRPEKEK
jgi:hypothetical protein